MANVFIAMYNFGRDEDFYVMPPFLEAFVHGMRKRGNNVLCYMHKTYGREFDEELPEDYRDKILEFDPDLCVLFCNNFWDISDLVSCPIVIYDIDSILEYKGIDRLRNNIDRYLFVINQEAASDLIIEKLDAKTRQIVYIPFFSEVQSDENAIIEENIRFLGTNWLWKGTNFVTDFMRKQPTKDDCDIARNVLEAFLDYPFEDAITIIDKKGFRPQIPLDIRDLKRAAVELSGIRRIRYLQSVADLGLEIRGAYWNIDSMSFFPEVSLCVNHQKTFSLEDNSRFYNGAKIALNTKHIQAQNGFSFRVCDILASNACLVSEHSEDLKKLFPNVGIPEFESEVEVRDCCCYLLENENARIEIVEKAHEAINEKYRFVNVLRALEELCGINLEFAGVGELEFFSDEFPKNTVQDLIPTKKKIIHVDKKRIRQFGIYVGKYNVFDVVKENQSIKLKFNPNHTFKDTVNNIEDFAHKKALKTLKNYHSVSSKRVIAKGEKLVVCLFVSRISCWMFGDLYSILEKSESFSPVVVVKPFMSQGQEAMETYLEDTYEYLYSEGYRVVKGYDKEKDTFLDVRNVINPDIVFYTSFWKPHFQKNFYISQFYDKYTFLVPYGFYVAEDDRSMNFELNNEVDGFFLPTEIHKNIASKAMDNKGRNVYVTGYPKLDDLWKKNYVPRDPWKGDKGKKRIIWAPHHEDKTPNWMYQFDAFYELKDIMIDIAKKYKNEIQIAFKPHPLLREKLNKRWGVANTNEYYEEWENLENGQLEEGAFIDLFLTSDAMILDSISFICEYMETYKPSLFTVGRNSRVYLNELGQEAFSHMYKANSGSFKQDIENFIVGVVISGNDYEKNSRIDFVDDKLCPKKLRDASLKVFETMCDVIGIKESVTQHY